MEAYRLWVVPTAMKDELKSVSMTNGGLSVTMDLIIKMHSWPASNLDSQILVWYLKYKYMHSHFSYDT